MKIKKAIIPAAGLGTRFLPITKAIPKPMLSVVDKPTIQYITEELFDAGIEEIIAVVSPDSDVIEKHFGKAKELEQRLLLDGKNDLLNIELQTQKFNVKFVEQTTANGLAGAILCAKQYVKGEPFALLLGDELLYAENKENSCIKQLVEAFEKTGNSTLSTMEVFGDDVSKYGNIGIESEENGVIKVNRIVEKPSLNDALSNNAIIGRYVLSGEIWELLENLKPKGTEIYLTDALDVLAKSGKLDAIVYKGDRFDVGDKLGFVKANVEFAIRSKEIGEDTKAFIKTLASKL